ncbi:MAG TPA: GNAT family protein [Bryobacteraceae bacterium]|nr:GNAT family protein [Bryobacteraceae bacterium]
MSVRVEKGFPLYAVPRVWQWMSRFRGRVADDFSPKTLDEFVARWVELDARGRKTWQVIRDGDLGGVIESSRLSPVLADLHCIFKRSFWGHETTVASLRMVCEELFADGVIKIMSTAFRSNHALIGIVKALGGSKEGLLAGQTLQNGKPVDAVILGLRKEDYVIGSESVRRESRQHVRVWGQQLEYEQQLECELLVKRIDKHPANADSVPVGASADAVQLHQQSDGEPAIDGAAVPAASRKPDKPELQRVSG